MDHGRKLTNDTDERLSRGLRLVNETIEIGVNTNKALQEQGMQIEKINNDLDDMQFSIKAAAKHLKEMTRSARPPPLPVPGRRRRASFLCKRSKHGRFGAGAGTERPLTGWYDLVSPQMATDKCILAFLLLIIGGIVAIVVMKARRPLRILLPLHRRSLLWRPQTPCAVSSASLGNWN